jgi:tetratricopeptide (TPR) repeat protein
VRQPPTAGPEPQQEAKSAADQRYSGASHTETDRSQAHLEAGRILPARNRVDEAVTEFRQGLRLQLYSAETHRALSAALFEKGDVDGAIAEYRDALRLGPDDAGDHINIGLALYVKGDLDGAIAEYREAVRLNPNDPNNHFLLGNALAKKPDLDACIAELRETVRLRPDLPRRTITSAQHSSRGTTGARLSNSTASPTASGPITWTIASTTSICRTSWGAELPADDECRAIVVKEFGRGQVRARSCTPVGR